MGEIEDLLPPLHRRGRALHDGHPARPGGHRPSRPGARSPSSSSTGASSPSATTRPAPSRASPSGAERLDLGCSDGRSVLIALLDAIVERLADILEAVGARPRRAVAGDLPPRRRTRRTGRRTTAACCRASAARATWSPTSSPASSRSSGSSPTSPPPASPARTSAIRLKSLSRDTRFLADHAGFLAQKVTFLLDATLGMIYDPAERHHQDLLRRGRASSCRRPSSHRSTA